VVGACIEGTLRKGQKIRLWSTDAFSGGSSGRAHAKQLESTNCGGEADHTNIQDVADTKIGDTITDDDRPALEALPGLKRQRWFRGLYTVDAH